MGRNGQVFLTSGSRDNAHEVETQTVQGSTTGCIPLGLRRESTGFPRTRRSEIYNHHQSSLQAGRKVCPCWIGRGPWASALHRRAIRVRTPSGGEIPGRFATGSARAFCLFFGLLGTSKNTCLRGGSQNAPSKYRSKAALRAPPSRPARARGLKQQPVSQIPLRPSSRPARARGLKPHAPPNGLQGL